MLPPFFARLWGREHIPSWKKTSRLMWFRQFRWIVYPYWWMTTNPLIGIYISIIRTVCCFAGCILSFQGQNNAGNALWLDSFKCDGCSPKPKIARIAEWNDPCHAIPKAWERGYPVVCVHMYFCPETNNLKIRIDFQFFRWGVFYAENATHLSTNHLKPPTRKPQETGVCLTARKHNIPWFLINFS